MPLHHPTAILVSVGGALAAGSRLALAERFSPSTFITEVRRAGATVVFYAGEMLRPLLFERPSAGDRTLPIRLFAGSGMRVDLAAKLRERFGASVMEFYAGTQQLAILANASGEKPGALGRILPGSAELRLVRCDLGKREPLRDENGAMQPVRFGEPGLLVSRAGEDWVVSNDVVRRDEDGDFWFVDSVTGFVATTGGPVSTRKVEDALYALPEIELAAVTEQEGALVAAIQARSPVDRARIDEALGKLAPHERPSKVVQVPSIPLTDGFRPKKQDVLAVLASSRPSPVTRASDGADGQAARTS
jgi:putative long chain acyl-CoA synthase